MKAVIISYLCNHRRSKGFTAEEWRILYDDTFNKVFHDVKVNLYLEHVWLDSDEVKQTMEYVFFNCYRNFVEGCNTILFPPYHGYFWATCVYKCSALIKGNPPYSAGFTAYDPNILAQMVEDVVEPYEDKIDFLDLYLMGANYRDMQEILGLADSKTMSKRVRWFIQAQADVNGNTYEEQLKIVRKIHKDSRIKRGWGIWCIRGTK